MKTVHKYPLPRTAWATACLLVILSITPGASADAPACPSDGTTIFSQLPDLDYWTLAFSNVVAGYGGLRYENFFGVDQRITGVRFWGLGFQYCVSEFDSWWAQCFDDPMAFEIRIYEDAAGSPGTLVYSGTFSLAGTLVGSVGYPQFGLYEYTANLDTPVALQRGWISIAGPGSCWFAWMNSADGDGYSRLSWPVFPSAWNFDLALCLMTDFAPVYGACCYDAGAGCQTNVLMNDCHGRFIAGGTCDDFNPPCGQVTGACCHADGTCDVTVWEGCEGFCAGDLDCNGAVGFSDINPFVLALSNPPAYLAQYPSCPLRNGDCTGDGIVNFADINPFITRIGAACAPQAGTWLGADNTCAACPPPPIVCPTGLPYSNTNTTCGRENDFDATCLGPYDGGAEIVYELRVPDQPVDVEITLLLDPNDTPYTGLLLADHWPPDADCLAMSTSAAAAAHSLGCQHLDPGTYYVMVDNWPAPDCVPQFTLQVTACTPVVGRCCFVDRSPCAEITAAACASLGGTWTAGLECTTPCPSIDGEDCAHAMPIPLVPFSRSFTNNAMTADGPAATCDKYGRMGSMVNDAWFVWTADSTCYATATVTADYDAVLVVRDGCDGAELQCADSGGTGGAETVSFPAVTGTTYYFQVGTAGNHPGGGLNHFTLNCTGVDGACCFPSALCLSMSGLECRAQGGMYQGDNVSCDTANCRAPQPGDDCAQPLTVTLTRASLPYVDTNTTVGRGNDYADTCLGSYDSGDDIIYELTVTETLVVTIKMDPKGTPFTGFLLSRECPPGSNCLGRSVNAAGTLCELRYVVLVPGVYYVMIDRWLGGPGIPEFELRIEAGDTQSGACCTGTGCVQTAGPGPCLDVGGSWFRGQSCYGTCAPMPGDTCANPIIIEIGAEPYFDEYASTEMAGNTYAGTTCLGLRDGGRDMVYALEVSADVVVDIELAASSFGSGAGLALSNTCPPDLSCTTATTDDFTTHYFHDLQLTPGTYYLLIDMWPLKSAAPFVFDGFDYRLLIQPASPPAP